MDVRDPHAAWIGPSRPSLGRPRRSSRSSSRPWPSPPPSSSRWRMGIRRIRSRGRHGIAKLWPRKFLWRAAFLLRRLWLCPCLWICTTRSCASHSGSTGRSPGLRSKAGCRACSSSTASLELLALLPQPGGLLSLCQELPQRLDASSSPVRRSRPEGVGLRIDAGLPYL